MLENIPSPTTNLIINFRITLAAERSKILAEPFPRIPAPLFAACSYNPPDFFRTTLNPIRRISIRERATVAAPFNRNAVCFRSSNRGWLFATSSRDKRAPRAFIPMPLLPRGEEWGGAGRESGWWGGCEVTRGRGREVGTVWFKSTEAMEEDFFIFLFGGGFLTRSRNELDAGYWFNFEIKYRLVIGVACRYFNSFADQIANSSIWKCRIEGNYCRFNRISNIFCVYG